MATSGLGNLLVNEGLLTENDRRTIIDTAGRGSSSFAKGVLALGLLDEEELATFIATRTRFPLAARSIDTEIKVQSEDALSPKLLKLLEVLPLKMDDSYLTIAMVDPLDSETAHQVEFFSGRRVKPVVATMSQIIEGLQRILPEFAPSTSPLEEFLANHAESAGRLQNGGGFAGGQGGDSEGQSENQMAEFTGGEEVSGAADSEGNEFTEGLDGADLSQVDTISKDVQEVDQQDAEDPFAKMDDSVGQDGTVSGEVEESVGFDETPLESETAAATQDLPDEAMDAGATLEPSDELMDAGATLEPSDELMAAGADQGTLGESGLDSLATGQELETVAALPEDGTDNAIIDRPMAEASQQEEVALAQELGLEAADMAVNSGQVPDTSQTESSDFPEASVDGTELLATPEGDSLVGESPDGPAVFDEGAVLVADSEPAVHEVASEVSPPGSGIPEEAPDTMSAAQKIAIINRTLLGIQLASSQEKMLEETAKGLGRAGCIPGVLLGRAKDGGKVLFMWEGSSKNVKVTHAQLGQLDTKALEDVSQSCPQGVMVPLSQDNHFLGMPFAADRSFVVSFTNADGTSFAAAFAGGFGFKEEAGLHATMLELLRRVAARFK